MIQKSPNNRLKLSRLTAGFLAVCSLILSVIGFGSRVQASSLAEGYDSSNQFSNGMLVSSSNTVAGEIEIATIGNSNQLLGVVQEEGLSTVTFASRSATVHVATDGVAATYVSDVNGVIKKGDYIGPSWVDGVGMKVLDGDAHKILGVALEDFDSSAAKEFSDVKTPSGTKTVKLGSVAVRLSGPPSKQVVVNGTGVAGFTQKLVGREVSYVRAIISFGLFFITLVVSSIFIRTSIKNSFISIGRNPMSSKSIYRSLLQVSIVSMIIILVGTAVAYAVVVL